MVSAVAGIVMPHVVGVRSHLRAVPPFIRRLFWVYYAFIGLCLAGFSVITVMFASTLAEGSGLARAVCAFLALFWTLRLVAATWILDTRPYLTTTTRTWGNRALNLVFACLPVVYSLAAIRPSWLR
jgi:hypothetical protein